MRLIYGRLWFLLLKLMDEQVKKEGKGFYDYPINEKKSIWKEWSKFILPSQL
jgi:3-hydroxyacyl-CoA dehydrogenase/enoyl-CoA hydratase/3-hydroxybutyryl-CoA epimerase